MSPHRFETPSHSPSLGGMNAHDSFLVPRPPNALYPAFSVYQLTLLEVDYNGTDTPTGVVLALVGSCREDESSSKDIESAKSLRMYSLSSIISLAKWAASAQVTFWLHSIAETAEMTRIAHSQYSQPLQMRGSTPGNPHRVTIRKGHRPHRSITKGLKSMTIDNQVQAQPYPFTYDPMSPMHSSPVVSPSTSSVSSPFLDELRGPKLSYTPTQSMDSIDETWDVVDDLPYRWATDYVSLAISGSRLANTSVLFYDIWSDPVVSGRKGALLAVATKSTILLYETPKGERAFRFVKVSHSRSYLTTVAGPDLCGSLWDFSPPRNSISLAHLEPCVSCTNLSPTQFQEARPTWGVPHTERERRPRNSLITISAAYHRARRASGIQTNSPCSYCSRKRPGPSGYQTRPSATSN